MDKFNVLKISNPWLRHYSYNILTNKCKCNNCKEKEGVIGGINIHNLKRHLIQCHKKIADEDNIKTVTRKKKKTKEINRKNDEIPVKTPLTGTNLMKHCIALAAFKFLPFSIFDDENFQSITIDSQEKTKTNISSYTVKKNLDKVAECIRTIIKDEMKNTPISIKVDLTSRHNKSYIGVNAQYYDKKTNDVVIRTIGIIELITSHTSANLLKMIKNLLEKFEVDISSVIAYVSDNSNNVIAAGKGLQHDQMNKSLMKEDTSEESTNDEDFDSSFECDGFDPSIASIVRCAEHTLQLSINDFHDKIFNNSNTIESIRTKVNALKSSEFIENVISLKIKRPSVDCPHRWHSTYKMLHQLKEEEEKIKKLPDYLSSKDAKRITIQNDEWIFLKKYVTAFRPVNDFTIQIESEKMNCGDFYVHYLRAKEQLNLLEDENDFVPLIKNAMHNRLHAVLLENDAFLSCLYMDPRVNHSKSIFGSKEIIEKAENFVLRVYKNLKNHDESTELTLSQIQKASKAIKNFNVQERVMLSDDSFNIFEHIKSIFEDDTLVTCCLEIACVPMTSCSVERAFSKLRLLHTYVRSNLSSSSVDNTLIIHLNQAIFNDLDFSKIFQK